MAKTRNQQRTPASGSRRKRGEKQPLQNQIDVDSNTAKEEESSNRVSATIGGHSDSPLLKKRKQVIDVFQELVSNSIAICRELEQVRSEIREVKKILKDYRSGSLQSSLLPPPLSPAESTVTTADVAETEGDAQSVMI